MKVTLMSLYCKIETLLSQDDGQDLVEYALIACMIALGCAAGMNSLASVITNIFFVNATNIVTQAFS